MWLMGLLAGCTADEGSAVDRLVRVSMAVRGVRPSPEAIARVRTDPFAVEQMAEGWLSDPAFGATIRDLHAEQFLTRFDARDLPATVGPLAGFTPAQVVRSLHDEPVAFAEWLVVQGHPYTDLVTSDIVVADAVVAAAYGLVPVATGGAADWAPARWSDGRPSAGILSSTALWQRYMSSPTNHHRGRAAFVREKLLCDPFPGGAVVSDPSDTASLQTDPACAGCHTVLDPMASAFFGFRNYILPSHTAAAHAAGCPPEWAHACYPLRMWDPEAVATASDVGMPAPALAAREVSDLAAFGQAIADDPRFASCTARRFAAYLQQTDWDAVPQDQVSHLTDVFVAAGYDARALVLAIVLDPSFATDDRRLQARPEQLARATEALTGFRWEVEPGGNHGLTDLTTTDDFGMRTILGGVDGWSAIRPVYEPTATRELALQRFAEQAASYAVEQGRLPVGDSDRDKMHDLYLRILAEPDADIGPGMGLLRQARRDAPSEGHAWKVVITAMLLDLSVVTY